MVHLSSQPTQLRDVLLPASACVLIQPHAARSCLLLHSLRLPVLFSTLQILFAFETKFGGVSPSPGLVLVGPRMNSSSSESYGVGLSSSQIRNMHGNHVHIQYMTQTEPIFNPAPLRNEPEPSPSGSLGALQSLISIRTGHPLFHAQQEPTSPSSGGFPDLTPSQSLSTILSDCSTGVFGGAEETSSLNETASSSDLVRRRGFSATLDTPSTSGSSKEDGTPEIAIDDALGIRGNTDEHMGLLRGINDHSE
jgi:hypothetical protein